MITRYPKTHACTRSAKTLLNNARISESVPFDPYSIAEKYSCDSESRECILNLCDECKYQVMSENGEANEDESDSDSKTNMLRYYL